MLASPQDPLFPPAFHRQPHPLPGQCSALASPLLSLGIYGSSISARDLSLSLLCFLCPRPLTLSLCPSDACV